MQKRSYFKVTSYVAVLLLPESLQYQQWGWRLALFRWWQGPNPDKTHRNPINCILKAHVHIDDNKNMKNTVYQGQTQEVARWVTNATINQGMDTPHKWRRSPFFCLFCKIAFLSQCCCHMNSFNGKLMFSGTWVLSSNISGTQRVSTYQSCPN